MIWLTSSCKQKRNRFIEEQKHLNIVVFCFFWGDHCHRWSSNSPLRIICAFCWARALYIMDKRIQKRSTWVPGSWNIAHMTAGAKGWGVGLAAGHSSRPLLYSSNCKAQWCGEREKTCGVRFVWLRPWVSQSHERVRTSNHSCDRTVFWKPQNSFFFFQTIFWHIYRVIYQIYQIETPTWKATWSAAGNMSPIRQALLPQATLPLVLTASSGPESLRVSLSTICDWEMMDEPS